MARQRPISTTRKVIGKRCGQDRVLLCRKKPVVWTTRCPHGCLRNPKTHRCRKEGTFPYVALLRLRKEQRRWRTPHIKRRVMSVSSSQERIAPKCPRRMSPAPSQEKNDTSKSKSFSNSKSSSRSLRLNTSPSHLRSITRSPPKTPPSRTIIRSPPSTPPKSHSPSRSITGSPPRTPPKSPTPSSTKRSRQKKKQTSQWPPRKGPKNAKRVQARPQYYK